MFKQCSVCGHRWATRRDFMADVNVEIIGYQANFKNLTSGLLYFNHVCKNTIALHADVFADLYDGPVFKERKFETDECPGYCLHKADLRPCPAECECSYIREIMQLLKRAKKTQTV